jgi:hypothetical protein
MDYGRECRAVTFAAFVDADSACNAGSKASQLCGTMTSHDGTPEQIKPISCSRIARDVDSRGAGALYAETVRLFQS